MARAAAQIGIVRDKAVRTESDHAGHPADADHAAAAGIDLAGNGVDALAIDDVSKNPAAVDVESKPRGRAIRFRRNVRDPPTLRRAGNPRLCGVASGGNRERPELYAGAGRA